MICYDLVSHVDSGFSGNIAPKPIEISTTEPSGTRLVSLIEMKNVYRTRALQWVGLKQSSGKLLTTVIDKEENFN